MVARPMRIGGVPEIALVACRRPWAEGEAKVLGLGDLADLVTGVVGGDGGRGATRNSAGRPLGGGGHGGVERGEIAHHSFVLCLLVSVYGLGVLAEVVKAGELLATVTGERAFASVFPVMTVLVDPRLRRRRRADLMWRARCSLLEKTILHSP